GAPRAGTGVTGGGGGCFVVCRARWCRFARGCPGVGVAGGDEGGAGVGAVLELDVAQEAAVAVLVVGFGVADELHGGAFGEQGAQLLGGGLSPALAGFAVVWDLWGVDAEEAYSVPVAVGTRYVDGVAVEDVVDDGRVRHRRGGG